MTRVETIVERARRLLESLPEDHRPHKVLGPEECAEDDAETAFVWYGPGRYADVEFFDDEHDPVLFGKLVYDSPSPPEIGPVTDETFAAVVADLVAFVRGA